MPYPNDFSVSGDLVEIIVEGINVQGKITFRSAQDIIVEITHPYQGASERSLHIPAMAVQFKNYRGQDGDIKAAAMLYALYRFCEYAQDVPELGLALQNYRKALHYATCLDPEMLEMKEQISALQAMRSKLKAELKAGAMSSTKYQQELKPIRQELEDLKFASKVNFRTHFDECFALFRSTPVGGVHPETVIAYLSTLHEV